MSQPRPAHDSALQRAWARGLPFAPTLLAGALAAVFLPAPGLAAEQTIAAGRTVAELRLREVGGNGDDAEWHAIFSNDESTAGKPGAGVSATNHGTITTGPVLLREAALLESQGGRGGKGDGLLSASRGGNGGTVRMSNDGIIREALSLRDNPGPTSLIRLSSRGGDGGSAQLSASSNGRLPPGTGGSGGDVSFATTTSIQAFMATTVIDVESRGGDSGSGGYTRLGQTRPGPTTAAAGGEARIQVDSQATIIAGTPGTAAAPSSALRARSIGGNGGAGGDTNGFLTFATDGNHGGAGATARTTIDGKVETRGAYSLGVMVSSQGGRGGGGGDDGAVLDAVPGAGGRGGASGTAIVTVAQGASITTAAADAPAVLAESRGGDGGNAGEATAFGSVINVGSSGGKGGDAPDSAQQTSVRLDNAGSIRTQGDRAVAVTLQSVGGRGGNGSSTGGSTSAGGQGGQGGRITGSNTGEIATQGASAFGVFAQSVGGTGGVGGNGNFLNFGGAAGGNAGRGGQVDLVNTGSIQTQGQGAAALVGQSVGGGAPLSALQVASLTARPVGGGAGGSSAWGFFAAVGGAGGSGGHGGAVNVTAGGTIATQGKDAYGVVAQSIGGGGGVAGNADAAGIGFAVAVGGSGGQGGNGGTVTLARSTAAGSIATRGDNATAMFAQSVGGSGGAAGSASASSIGALLSWSLAIGGNGGGGGNGGVVSVGNASSLTTRGNSAHGIVAQSVGGGGGVGGAADASTTVISLPELPDIGMTYALGGKGGAGGNGQNVTVDNHGAIQTRAVQSHAIKALSVGGGGGLAGAANAATNLLGTKLNIGLSYALGGAGQAGGSGGDVKVTSDAALQTRGQFSHGIAAASVGGGGGAGGPGAASTAVGIQQSKELDSIVQTFALADSIKADISLGGSAARGGQGGVVEIHARGNVLTHGANATAIFAQSVGGGGGNAGGFSGGGSGTLSGNLNVGGTGGSGGAGGKVTVTTAQGIEVGTRRAGSHAVFAQSVGGGGGNGGSFTGEESDAPDVSADSLTRIVEELGKYYELSPAIKNRLDRSQTTKDTFEAVSQYLRGFNAEVIDGKKLDVQERIKSAGFYVQLQTAQYLLKDKIDKVNEGLKEGQVSVPNLELAGTFGGKGASGGAGGVVTITNDARVATQGNHAHALLAQSVGGGGGSGGSAHANGSSKINLKYTLGGDGNQGGAGGNVTVGNTGRIDTKGELSSGIFAQSVGGGGGLGGGSANADSISVSANATLGGNSGRSSPGGVVTVNQGGTIVTQGKQSHGVFAQSVGGGGGAFYVNQAAPLTPERFAGDVTDDVRTAEAEALKELQKLFSALGAPNGGSVRFDTHATILPTPSVDLKFGGRGGEGGAGGAVNVFHDKAIETYGNVAFGIFAQSIGGGGGAGGNTGNTGYGKVSVGMGGLGGKASDGGAVGVTLGNGATILTHGEGAAGIMAQSIGGGGGYAGSWDAALLAGSRADSEVYLFSALDGGSGDGGSLTVAMRPDATASIRTRGERAHGIVAQSLGGGGGLVADAHGLLLPPVETGGSARVNAKGQGGTITLTTAGSIVAEGKDAHGIFAQSGVQTTTGALDAGRQGGDILVQHTGTLQGGSGTGAAVVLEGGASNRVTFGAGAQVSALSGTAVRGSFGNDTVDNHGTLTGRIDLASAAGGRDINTVNNLRDGRVNLAGARLGAQGWFDNAGTLAIGTPGTVDSARIEGSLNHRADATLLVDISPSAAAGQPTSDRLDVTGDTRLQGHVQPGLVTALLPGRYTFLQTEGHLDANGADAVSQWPRHVPIAWSVERSERTLALVPTAHFATPEGITLSDNQRATAEHLQQAWDQGTPGQADTFAGFVQTPSAQAYADSLDSMSPENVQATAVARLQASRAALKSVMSCPAFVGSGTEWREGECAWGQATVTHTHQHETNAIQGYRHDAAVYRFGAQREVRPDWFVGVSAAYTDSRLDGLDGLSRSRGDGADLAVALKHQYGNWLFAGSLAAGHGWFDNRRTIQLGNDIRQAQSDSRVTTLGARLRAAYQFAGPRAYVRPQLDLDVIHTRKPGYTESGAGSLDLEVSGMRDTTLALRPNVEFGARVDLASGGWLRPYGSLGVTLLSDDALSTQANLRGLDGVVSDFRTTSHMTRVLGDAGVGIHLMTGKGYELTAEYQAQFGRNVVSHQGSARLAVRF